VRAGETEALPLSLSLKGIYEAEDGSVLTGEIEAYEAARPSFKPRTLPAKFLPKEDVVSARD